MLGSRPKYATLLLVRFILCLLPGYIHPDEYFQAPEVSAGDILGVYSLRTWEFNSDNPIRSIVPIYTYSGVPFLIINIIKYITAIIGYRFEITSTLIFCISRVYMASLSLIIDLCIYTTIKRLNPAARLRPTMIMAASSFCLAVFHTHTFANSFASIIMALCFDCLSRLEKILQSAITSKLSVTHTILSAKSSRLCFVFGMLLSFGVFTHVTFAVYSIPLAIVWLSLLVRLQGSGSAQDYSFLRNLALLISGSLMFAGVTCIVDSIYFHRLHIDFSWYPSISGSLVCTILNNVLYNTDENNLAMHGIHQRYMHVLVSMPILFGPLYILSLAKGWSFIRHSSARQNVSYTTMASAMSVIFGLLILSVIPHQEPRFLLLAFPGMIICTWSWHRIAPQYFWLIWIAFNVILSIVYSVFHQAGVVPALRFLSTAAVSDSVVCIQHNNPESVICSFGISDHQTSNIFQLTTNVYLYSTYMAPRHLLVQKSQNKDVDKSHSFSRVNITDLVSFSDQDVRELISHESHVDLQAAVEVSNTNSHIFTRSTDGTYKRTLLVIPDSIDKYRMLPEDSSVYSLLPIRSFAPHVNFDHIQQVLQNPIDTAKLTIYLVTTGSLV